LSEAEEDQIARQIEDVEDQIKDDIEDFETRRADGLRELDAQDTREKTDEVSGNAAAQDPDAVGPKPQDTNDARFPVPESTDTNPGAPAEDDVPVDTATTDVMAIAEPTSVADSCRQADAQAKPEEIDEHHGETIVEAEEDTVIY